MVALKIEPVNLDPKNNREITDVERLRTPVAGILTPSRTNIRGIYGVDHDMTAVTDILIVGLQLN